MYFLIALIAWKPVDKYHHRSSGKCITYLSHSSPVHSCKSLNENNINTCRCQKLNERSSRFIIVNSYLMVRSNACQFLFLIIYLAIWSWHFFFFVYKRAIKYVAGADPEFSWRGGGGQKIMCTHAHHEPEVPFGWVPALKVFCCFLLLSEPYF